VGGTTNPNLYPPTIETTYNNLGTQYVLIEWNDMAEAEEYEVYKAYSRDGSYTKLGTTSNTSYQYTVNNDTDWQETLYFKVKSVDSAGRTSGDSNIESESIY
jgi:fibronectin type 3 domain-containing protein